MEVDLPIDGPNDDDSPRFSDDESVVDVKKPKKIKSESDDEDDDDLPLSKVRLKEKPGPDKVDLPNALKDSFGKFISSKNLSDFESFLADYRSNASSLDSEQEAFVLANILTIFKSTIPEKCDLNEFAKLDELENGQKLEQKLEQSINHPLYGIYKVLNQHEEKDKKCGVVTKILAHCHTRLPSMGFLLLYYLKVNSRLKNNLKVPTTFRSSVYKLFYQWINNKSFQKIDVCLERDLQLLEQYSINVFLWLLIDIYREFETHVINNSEILKIVVGCIDARNLHDLICDITQGKLNMFKNEGVLDCIRDSLEFETFEQLFFWQLLSAHDVPISYIQVNFNFYLFLFANLIF
jgi:integrator complex subunit 3